MTQIDLTRVIYKNQLGQRLDQALAKVFPDYSRSVIKRWIIDKRVLVNNKIWNKPKEKVLGGETVTINIKIKEETYLVPQDILLNIIYEDDDILIINKPSNLVVHPGAGNPDRTLLNALLHYYPSIVNIPRAGIVHRLDKDTTGLMVIAKSIQAQTRLVELLRLRRIIREYEAVAIGHIITGGTINAPIGRHPNKRVRMSVHPHGKPAVTHYQVIEHFYIYTRLRLRLETGRTHQIRVHMEYISHPLVGDTLYGTGLRLPKKAPDMLIAALRKFNRQALHATMLLLDHPTTGIKMRWYAPIPFDMFELIEAIRTYFEKNKDDIIRTRW